MVSVWGELQRRNVVKVALAYAIIGWLLIEVSSTVLPIFEAPDWIVQVSTFFVILGFPLALILSWAYELTPDGIKREKDVDRSESITHVTGRRLDFIIIGVLAVAVGFFVVDRFVRLPDPVTASDSAQEIIVTDDRQSIAVLPFVNMSDDSDHFADGLTEELMNLLARNRDLKVAGRTSSFAFKGQNPNFREVGAALNVGHVLEGSVRRSGDTLRITAQLIEVEDGYHIWSETYDRQLVDVFEIQDDVAGSITDALRLQLAPTAYRTTDNTQAYALYLEALALTGSSNPEDIRLAQELIVQAIALDPRFARAYELKAVFHWTGSGWLEDSPVAQALAYEAAMQALALDPTLAGARSFASTAKPDWNWIDEIAALEEYARAEPDNVVALELLVYELITGGYFEESARLAQRMIEIDPLSPLSYVRLAEATYGAGRRDEAHSYLDHATELEDEVVVMWLLGFDLLLEGDDEAAIRWIETQFIANGDRPEEVRALVESARQPDTGKEFLDQWVETAVANASNLDERRTPYFWYLAFGYLDEFWLGIEALASDGSGWSNADTLDHDGMVFRRTGFARHPKYVPRQIATGLADLWDVRGPPDHCDKVNAVWVCE